MPLSGILYRKKPSDGAFTIFGQGKWKFDELKQSLRQYRTI
jgi:hypothetical protein